MAMAKGLTSFSDLSVFDDYLSDPDHGREIAFAHMSKFIGNGGLIIACREDQTVTKEFWRGYLSVKQERLKAIRKLELVDLSEDSALNLATVMHDLRIKPRTVLFNGEDCNA